MTPTGATIDAAPGWGLPQASSLKVIRTYGKILERWFAASACTHVRDLLNAIEELGLTAVTCAWGKDTQALIRTPCNDLLPAYADPTAMLRGVIDVAHPQAAFDQRINKRLLNARFKEWARLSVAVRNAKLQDHEPLSTDESVFMDFDKRTDARREAERAAHSATMKAYWQTPAGQRWREEMSRTMSIKMKEHFDPSTEAGLAAHGNLSVKMKEHFDPSTEAGLAARGNLSVKMKEHFDPSTEEGRAARSKQKEHYNPSTEAGRAARSRRASGRRNMKVWWSGLNRPILAYSTMCSNSSSTDPWAFLCWTTSDPMTLVTTYRSGISGGTYLMCLKTGRSHSMWVCAIGATPEPPISAGRTSTPPSHSPEPSIGGGAPP